MKNSSILIGFTAIAVFAIVNVAAAATTIGTNIQTDGTLSVGTNNLVTDGLGDAGIGTTSPTSTLTVSNPTGTGTLSLWGLANSRFDIFNGDGNKYSLQFAGSGGTILKLQYNGATHDVFGSNGSIAVGYTGAATNMLDVVGGGVSISTGGLYGTAPNDGLITQGNVGFGTSTPATRLQISNGANATTTVTVGELGLSSSKGCVNINAADGSAASFYVSAAHTLVVEANYCK